MQNRFHTQQKLFKKKDLGPYLGFHGDIMVKIILGAIINMVV